jgi:hypothetical protein
LRTSQATSGIEKEALLPQCEPSCTVQRMVSTPSAHDGYLSHDGLSAIGSGWTALYFHLQADGETVSGMAGGLATLVIGIDLDI